MSALQKIIPIYEGSDYYITLKFLVDTRNATVSVRTHASDAADGTTTEIGSAAGVEANSTVEILLNTKALTPGNYLLEFYANHDESDQIMLNNDNEIVYLKVKDAGGEA